MDTIAGPPQKRLRSEDGTSSFPHPLPPGWTEHIAPTGHKYYYNKTTKKSTYTRPAAESAEARPPVPPPIAQSYTEPQHIATNTNATQYQTQTQPQSWNGQTSAPHDPLIAHYNGMLHQPLAQEAPATVSNNQVPRKPLQFRQPEDRPKRKGIIPNCGSWVLVYTRLGRRFVHNTQTRESFWKFPTDVMKAVIALDQMHLEEKHGKPQNAGQESGQDKELAVAAKADGVAGVGDEEERIWVPPAQSTQDKGYDSSEYEEIEVTDDSGAESNDEADEDDPSADPHGPVEFNEDDIAYQLAAMGESYGLDAEEYGSPGGSSAEEEEGAAGLPLTDTERNQIFSEMLADHEISPFTPWESILAPDSPHRLLDDDRFTILPSARARKEAFAEWAKTTIAAKKASSTTQSKGKEDPRVRFLAFLASNASVKLYWPEFKRKFKREAPLKPTARFVERDMEKLYRDFVAKLKTSQGTREAALREVVAKYQGAGDEDMINELDDALHTARHEGLACLSRRAFSPPLKMPAALC
ncbi:hypothetical protein ANO11243_077370 [Dothideomycetidae sp. 11243]|nr:hypothetical protein ANO11243_077370 [fungal sp. No.11243]